jgi:UDP-N-acetylmuramoyl-L-alanyl-D-glutamate--2,6-diaminopimelate ligase
VPTTGLVRAPAPARRLQEVADRLDVPAPPAGHADVLVTGISLDSRTVQPGDLYAALPGARTHGARFTASAAAAGAVAVLTDPAGAATAAGLPALVVPHPRAVLGGLAAWLFGEPARRMTTFGVTGTNGKTTTTYLLDGALRAGGCRTGLVGTVETRIGEHRLPSVRTTPEATDLQALLARMAGERVGYCSMEVSSHALVMGRVDGVVFDVAGFTNLSQDHLDYHATMEDYFAAKAALFTPAHARRGVVVVDDAWGRRLAGSAGVPVQTLATRGPADADWHVADREPDGEGTAFTLTGPDGAVRARCPLPGDFNVANSALALAMMAAAGLDLAAAAEQLAVAEPVPGRMQPVPGPPDGPLAVIDYAHTPDAVRAALDALAGRRPLVVVLGAGGDRDRAKRPLMGAAAARVADVLIVTDDNPRSEDPAAIRAGVLAGTAGGRAEVLQIADRRAAIVEGVRRAGTGTLLVAGKGHETGQEVAGVVHPFDDREVTAEALAAGRVSGR